MEGDVFGVEVAGEGHEEGDGVGVGGEVECGAGCVKSAGRWRVSL